VIQLDVPTAQINLITGGAQAIAVTASYVDAGPANAYDPGVAPNQIVAAAGTVPLVMGPAASFQRNVNKISLLNTDASVTCQVTVQNFDGTTAVTEITVALPAGWGLYYEGAGAGWYVMSPDGGRLGLKGNTGAPGTNGTNGTNAGNIGTATLDFGPLPGSNEATVTVTGQTTILSTSAVQVFFMSDVTIGGHTPNDHAYAAALVGLTAGVVTAGVGFPINARSTQKFVGQFALRFNWN
jgi:hypothetical protein